MEGRGSRTGRGVSECRGCGLWCLIHGSLSVSRSLIVQGRLSISIACGCRILRILGSVSLRLSHVSVIFSLLLIVFYKFLCVSFVADGLKKIDEDKYNG